MNWKLSLLAASALTAMCLASCGSMGRKSSADGMTIYNPTVADMERYEAQWGMPPKSTSTQSQTPAVTPAAGANVPPGAPGTPTFAAPATAPVETAQPATAPATPPSLR